MNECYYFPDYIYLIIAYVVGLVTTPLVAYINKMLEMEKKDN